MYKPSSYIYLANSVQMLSEKTQSEFNINNTKHCLSFERNIVFNVAVIFDDVISITHKSLEHHTSRQLYFNRPFPLDQLLSV